MAMHVDPSSRTRFARSGAILLECLLAMALLIAAGVTVLACMDRAADAVIRGTEEAQARQIVSGAMSLIEAGVMTPETIQGPVRKWRTDASVPADWNLAVETQPTEFTGLTTVTLRVFKGSRGADSSRPLATLHQLIDLNAMRERASGGRP
jgi:hypothetical protein